MMSCFPHLNWHWLVWVAPAPLLIALVAERRLGRAFLLGYLSGAVFLGGNCYWFVGVMEVYGRMQAALAAGALLLFTIIFAVFFGVFGLVEGYVARRSVLAALLLSPLVWVSMEVARTYLITGFPWDLLGYAVQASGLEQAASFTAVYGLSFLAVATSALASWALLNRRRRQAWLMLAIWAGLLIAGDFLMAPPPVPPGRHSALLVQPNVPLDESALEAWVPSRDPKPLQALVALTLDASLRRQARQAGQPAQAGRGGQGGAGHDESASPALIVWAENPAPFYFERDPVFRGAAEDMARRSRAYVVLNTVTFEGQAHPRPRNTAVLLDPEGRAVFQYDKIHLVPFGEYVPWWAFPGKVGKITSEVGDFVPGSAYRVASTPEGKIGIFICYESIFPQLVRRLVRAGAGVLVNISNDAWYGDSPAAWQHFEMARVRAIENGRYLLRATNDGITAVIDPYGRVIAQIPRHRREVLTARFDFETRATFYTAHGDLFAWLCVLISAGVLAREVVARRRNLEVRS